MKLPRRSTASTRSPLAEAAWSVCAWAFVAPVWYIVDSMRSPIYSGAASGAIAMLPWFFAIAAIAFALRFLTTHFFRSRAAYYLIDIAVLWIIALVIALFTGNSVTDPQGALVFLSIRLLLTGTLLVCCTVTLSIVLSSSVQRLRAPRQQSLNIAAPDHQAH